MDTYEKVHLVPFGEYVPLKRYLPFVHRLVVSAGDFKSGEKVAPLRFPEAAAGVLICFESIFPELARAMTKNGAEFLVNLTNDAWSKSDVAESPPLRTAAATLSGPTCLT